MTTIQAVVNVGKGVAELQNVPYPTLPGDEYILVKATAWAINPDDVYKLDLPEEDTCAGTRVGADFAGHVLEVGSGVTKGFKKGDRVAGMVLSQNIIRKEDGAFAEVFAVKGDVQLKTPDSLSDAEAATQGVSVATMAQSLYRGLGLPLPGSKLNEPATIFIIGGSSAMGLAAVQLAKLSGATVITTASSTNAEYVRSLGADHVLDYKSPQLVEDVLKVADGPVPLVFDAYPNDDSPPIAAGVLSTDGKGRYLGLLPGLEEKVKSLNPTVNASSVLVYSISGEPYWFEKEYFEAKPADVELQKSFVPVAEKLLAEGKLKVPRIFLNRGGKGLEGVVHGLKEMRANNVRGGKLVYTAG